MLRSWTRRALHISAVLAMAVAISACASIKGTPETSSASGKGKPKDFAKYSIGEVLTEDNLSAALKNNDLTPIERNQIVYAGMAEIDALYADYETAIVAEVRSSGFLATLAELSVDVTGAFVGGGASKILSAVSAGITGAKESFDKDILIDRTAQALTAQMRANRDQAKARILPRLTRPTADYPLVAAIADLIEYRQAGTITSALHAIANDAGVAEAAAAKTLNAAEADVFIHKYGADDATDRIRDLWRPGGGGIDPAFDAELKGWLKFNEVKAYDAAGRPTANPLRISVFLSAARYAPERRDFLEYYDRN